MGDRVPKAEGNGPILLLMLPKRHSVQLTEASKARHATADAQDLGSAGSASTAWGDRSSTSLPSPSRMFGGDKSE